MITDVKTLSAESWFGYGRWSAPYWFIGMEPGGEDTHESYEAWAALDRESTGLVDCRQHHLWKRDVLGIEDSSWTRWHEDRPGRRTQPTWRRLIQTLLAFEGGSADLDAVYAYQKWRFGSGGSDGETAIVELGALHAPSLATSVDRESFRATRIGILKSRLSAHRPVFALCYGYGFREQFEQVVGSRFDAEGFTWRGATLCALTPGPTSRSATTAQWWIEKGLRMRALIHERC